MTLSRSMRTDSLDRGRCFRSSPPVQLELMQWPASVNIPSFDKARAKPIRRKIRFCSPVHAKLRITENTSLYIRPRLIRCCRRFNQSIQKQRSSYGSSTPTSIFENCG